MKITDMKVWVTKPEEQGRSYVFLRIDTDEGISGIGEATSSGGGGSIVVGNMLRLLRDSKVTQDFRGSLIGENPEDVDRLWHKLYRRFTGGGGYGGFVTTLLSGVDIALWDIKGKAAGKPIYQLFGGPIWNEVLLYTHIRPGNPLVNCRLAEPSPRDPLRRQLTKGLPRRDEDKSAKGDLQSGGLWPSLNSSNDGINLSAILPNE